MYLKLGGISMSVERCVSCEQTLEGGELVLPWADGNNPNGYVICPHCGYENTVYGIGEDDE